jgi:hypothetical protein
MDIRKITDDLSVAPQIHADDVAAIAPTENPPTSRAATTSRGP